MKKIPEPSCRRKEMKEVELLVKKAKRGDAEAFITLIEENKQSMYKVARGFLRDQEDVADAMAETVLNCFEKIGSLKQDSYFKTWMIRILINNCKDILKRQKRNILTEDIPEQAQQEMTAASGGVLEFQELIEPLKEQDRSIFTLYYVYGMKVKEIAACMEMKESTVVTRLKRGRETLRGEMTDSREKEGAYER
jgi:RNA polymerase sigma-70 factor (ECF subfamily)